MRDETIRAGDLVMLVRGHDCLFRRAAGKIYVVIDIVQPKGGGWTCRVCNMRSAGPNEPAAIVDRKSVNGTILGGPVSWFKKIHPPEAEHDTEREKEMAI